MPSQQNSEKYAPPEGYYDRTIDRPISEFLEVALSLHASAVGMTALDFGCGAGSQSKYMLKKGYNVVAVDGNPDAREYIERLTAKDKIRFVQSDFETFQFGKYDLINSLHALPFTNKALFEAMFTRLKASLNPNGIFAGQFYGLNDEWNTPNETMTFLSKAEVEKLFEDMKIISLIEKEQQGTIADNSPKHWHVFEVVAVKP